jgi:hypothetical protein
VGASLGVCALLLAVPATAQTVPPVIPATAAIPPANLGRIVRDSLKLLVVEHGVRVAFQPKTRDQLEGPFWRDYRRSVRLPRHWEDSDNWPVNYLGHPIHGAAAGFLWTIHDPAANAVPIGLDGAYWGTRWRPLVWSAIYSVQFEVGPFSEASVGNVGLRAETIGWVDYAVTPVGGFGLMVAEDALDRFFLAWFERHVRNRPARAILRTIFNPSRAMANVAANRLPWHRDARPLTATR